MSCQNHVQNHYFNVLTSYLQLKTFITLQKHLVAFLNPFFEFLINSPNEHNQHNRKMAFLKRITMMCQLFYELASMKNKQERAKLIFGLSLSRMQRKGEGMAIVVSLAPITLIYAIIPKIPPTTCQSFFLIVPNSTVVTIKTTM